MNAKRQQNLWFAFVSKIAISHVLNQQEIGQNRQVLNALAVLNGQFEAKEYE